MTSRQQPDTAPPQGSAAGLTEPLAGALAEGLNAVSIPAERLAAALAVASAVNVRIAGAASARLAMDDAPWSFATFCGAFGSRAAEGRA